MISEKIIQEGLERYYKDKAKYMLTNAFIYNWESDFWILRNSNSMAIEFEIKISRSDFFADKKKVEKHLLLSTGQTNNKRYTGSGQDRVELPTLRPNQFYYVVPKGLIKVEELPPYVGLIEMDVYTEGDYTSCYPAAGVKKRAPFLHKDILAYESILCPKFYYYWLTAKNKC
jgi:hypothetical protein